MSRPSIFSWTAAGILFFAATPLLADGLDSSEPSAMRRASVEIVPSPVSGETTYVGFSPNFAGSNYWSIGPGHFRPGSSNPNDYGYWDWDNDAVHNNLATVHGDSLFGWWPYRELLNDTGGLTLTDDQRPWWALDYGNVANYAINQGAGLKRTTGVVGVWHRDPGTNGSDGVGWTPLSGSYSLWCGLRRESDVSQIDPVTGNAYNGTVLANDAIGVGAGGALGGTNVKWPGYGGQWDQMAYRDLNVSGASTITLRFKYRTNLSTGYGNSAATRTGWFDKDPLNPLAPNNLISSSAAGSAAPIDSFMVYVGAPVTTSFVGSDGLAHSVFDPQRRWFSETIRVNEPGIPYRELFTTYGDHASSQVTSATIPVESGWSGMARVVFRSKTNRGFDDETGSVPGGYSSNGAGAVVVDDVEISRDGGAFSSLGDFETSDQVNNDLAVSPLDAWKTTGKPPGILAHVHPYDTLVYEDLCGPLGSSLRVCNLAGNVISFGDHDHSEAAGGAPGSADENRADAILSPAIALRSNGGTNAFGINSSIATATGDILIVYDVYTGVFNLAAQGNLWSTGFQVWPARQADGERVWSAWGRSDERYFPDKQCFQVMDGMGQMAIPAVWSAADAEGGAAYPDSIRFRIEKRQECYRFGVTTACSPTDGAYFDNVSLAFVDQPGANATDLSVAPVDLINDTFTVNGLNRNGVAPGTANFDTTAAVIRSGRNIAQCTGNLSRYEVPGDTTVVRSLRATRVDLLFRISPGPGNYVSAGVRSSGLRRVPTNGTAVDYSNPTNNGNFWAEYLRDNGEKGTPGGHPAGSTNGGKDWSALVWNSARCDTAEINLWRVASRNLGGPVPGKWAAMYHESDPKFTRLGLAKNRCWLKDPNGPVSYANTTCDISQTIGNWPVAAGYTAENGLPLGQTDEYTQILPDGMFTPGTHVEYVYRAEGAEGMKLGPDTNFVYPQAFEGSLDAHRWQEFSVLPDAWKKTSYGGLGQACILYVDWADGRGDERVWVSIADSICATLVAKYGAHNGWHAVGKADINDPSGFVRNLNQEPGTTWDMLGVRGGDDPLSAAGSLGADYASHAPSNVDGKWSFEGPSIGMLETYYKVLYLTTGDLNASILGPFANRSSDDTRMLREFMLGGTSSDLRGVWAQGDGFVEDSDNSGVDQGNLLHNFFKLTLRDPSYFALSNVDNPCVDLQVLNPITTNGDVYGVRNGCTFTNDVLTPGVGGVPASQYSPNGTALAPVVSGVFHDVNNGTGEFWKSLIDGFDISNLRGRYCYKSTSRLMYDYNVLTKIFGSICMLAWRGCPILDVPNSPDASLVAEFLSLRNTPLRSGSATVEFGLAAPDRVTVSLYDVAGRLVRTLADRRFAAGKQTVVWDGLDSEGRAVRHGVYFARVRYQQRGFDATRKLIVLK